ncbi:4-amino-4-deoxy-L-arabinose transferase-like glycosyltransferase [Nocardia pseudobrasiliensis]|uniref:4-amino-4-deoxy-L-arabinose transferase-like glycosyltransferase n=1 Tax=Nocardia pseudobrasiliensis TaxID=45979 RepID=A0A370I572_9NOCA|nr:4-amino-4-deoxy-L-arabinose transferase-like glycosyltransferase [Nocardia pseudobrasiliensis]
MFRSRIVGGVTNAGDHRRWARPAVWLIAAVAGGAYAWGIAQQKPQLYYAAVARSMSMSWHNFVFAAFDPEARLSVDKLPGAFWAQALSVRIFGAHVWAVVLPQVIWGVLTILLLYRVVRRVSGPWPAVAAAAVAACVPVTVALNRGNLPDSLLVLLLVAAVDRVLAALESDRRRDLVWAGVLIGAAFQVKMVQAWLVVPVIGVALLVTAPAGRLRRRIADTALFGVVALVFSLSWMTVVSLVPAHDRPYVDGSHDNSLFEQVFLYNAADRTDNAFSVGAANFAVGDDGRNYRSALVLGPDDHLAHIFTGGGGRDAGWLVPLALAALIALAVLARRRGRTDPRTAALVLWGGWLLVYLAVFLVIGTVNPYYLAALAPPIAALIGMAVAEYGSAPTRMRRVALVAVLATVAYGWWLLAPAPPTLRWVTLSVALALCALAVATRAVIPLLLAALAAPAVAAAALVVGGYGCLDMPFESAQTSAITQRFVGEAFDEAGGLLAKLDKDMPNARYPIVAHTSMVASPFIFVSGREIPSIGGYTGTAPAISVDDLARMVARHEIGIVLLARADDDRVRWVEGHCKHLPGDSGSSIQAYVCAAR